MESAIKDPADEVREVEQEGPTTSTEPDDAATAPLEDAPAEE